MFLSQESPELREAHVAYVNTRWEQLYGVTDIAAKDATTYLMVTNSGGAVAVLSFMGAMKTLTPIQSAIWILAFFILGIVLVGVLRAMSYYRSNWLFSQWRGDAGRYFADKIEWEYLIGEDEKRSKYYVWMDVVAWLSFACFLVGLLIGFVNILCTRG